MEDITRARTSARRPILDAQDGDLADRPAGLRAGACGRACSITNRVEFAERHGDDCTGVQIVRRLTAAGLADGTERP